MTLPSPSYYLESFELIVFFSLVGFIVHSIAKKWRFYELPQGSCLVHVSFFSVLGSFILYFLGAIPLTSFTFQQLLSAKSSFSAPIVFAWAQVIGMGIALLAISCFCHYALKNNWRLLWKKPGSSSYIQDILLGAVTWLVAFPLVAIVEQCVDMFVYKMFGFKEFEQVAVLYLKSALNSPLQLTAVFILILALAPLLEEILFRGLLQTWLKKHLGLKAAVTVSSLAFASFHISESHGFGNISLIISLFTFSCFLGFIYERQQSLLASISLHTTFNLLSALRIFFGWDV